MEIIQVPISELNPTEYNPRQISDHDKTQLRQSLEKFGFVEPLVVNCAGNRKNIIIGGHQRFFVAQEMNLESVPVYFVNIPEIEREKELNIRLNRNVGEWNWDILQNNFDLSGLLSYGFDAKELNFNFKFEDKDENADIPDPPTEPRSKLKEIYLLGKHRLMCGDPASIEDVSHLMDGKNSILFCTDPPYGVNYGDIANFRMLASGNKKDYEQRPYKDIENDDLMGEDLQNFLANVFKVWSKYLFDNAAWYLWHAQKTQGYFTAAAAAADIIYHRQIVWVKPQLILGRGDYHWKHELCLYGWKKGNRPPWHRGRDQHTVWEIERENEGIHPTQKPVEIFERSILNHTLPKEICAEPFSGSGTQFIACEKLNRICYGMEIDPAYCDVIIKRFCNFTGANEDEIFRNAVRMEKGS